MRLILAVLAAALGALSGAASASAEARASRLLATVGPGSKITVTDARGQKITTIKSGIYAILVRDRSSRENFHLIQPDPLLVNKTGLRYVGTATWHIRLQRGVYRYVSDAQPSKVRGSFRVI